jgi:hypothetical protein
VLVAVVAVSVAELGVEPGEVPTHPARPAAAMLARHARLEGIPEKVQLFVVYVLCGPRGIEPGRSVSKSWGGPRRQL